MAGNNICVELYLAAGKFKLGLQILIHQHYYNAFKSLSYDINTKFSNFLMNVIVANISGSRILLSYIMPTTMTLSTNNELS